MAVMEWYNMATNMAVIGVYGKSWKNADYPWKRNWKNCNGSKVMAKSKYTLKSGPFSFVFWPEISTSLRDPLGCSDLSQIFFGSSPIATELDKIVAEIIWNCIFETPPILILAVWQVVGLWNLLMDLLVIPEADPLIQPIVRGTWLIGGAGGQEWSCLQKRLSGRIPGSECGQRLLS